MQQLMYLHIFLLTMRSLSECANVCVCLQVCVYVCVDCVLRSCGACACVLLFLTLCPLPPLPLQTHTHTCIRRSWKSLLATSARSLLTTNRIKFFSCNCCDGDSALAALYTFVVPPSLTQSLARSLVGCHSLRAFFLVILWHFVAVFVLFPFCFVVAAVSRYCACVYLHEYAHHYEITPPPHSPP